MVLDFILQLVPWGIGLLILFFVWMIAINRQRLYKIRHTGRVSEIIDRRRNIIFFFIAIGFLVVVLFIDLFA